MSTVSRTVTKQESMAILAQTQEPITLSKTNKTYHNHHKNNNTTQMMRKSNTLTRKGQFPKAEIKNLKRGGLANIIHRLETEHGHSGAIIYRIRNNELSIIGVHKGAVVDTQDKAGVLLTTEIIDKLKLKARELGAHPFNVKADQERISFQKIGSAESCFNTAEHYFEQKKWQAAIKFYKIYDEVLDDEVVHFWANYNWALALVRLGQECSRRGDKKQKFTEAVQVINKLIQIYKDNALALKLKGYALSLLGDLEGNKKAYQEALTCFEKANEIEPKNFETLLNIGSINNSLNQFEKGLKGIQEAEKYGRTPELCNNEGFYFFKRGRELRKQEQQEKAKQEFEKAKMRFNEAVRFNQDQQEAHLNLGAMFLEQKDYKGAIREFQEGTRINRGNARSYSSLGMCYLGLREKKEALNNMVMALSLDPDSDQFYLNLSKIVQTEEEKEQFLSKLQQKDNKLVQRARIQLK